MTKHAIVQGLWFYDDLPLMQQMSLASFIRHGHEYHLYTYGEVADVPEGVVIRDANEILPEGKVFRDHNSPGYAAFADIFRYQLLANRGGWWVDTDVICLRAFDQTDDYVFSSEHVHNPEIPPVPNNAIMKLPAGAPILDYCIAVCSSTTNLETLEWAVLGPGLMKDAIPRYGLERFIVAPEVFCPVPWFRFLDLIEPDYELQLNGSTCAVHLWNAMWGRSNLDRSAAYHPDSAYERWKRTLLPWPKRREPQLVRREPGAPQLS